MNVVIAFFKRYIQEITRSYFLLFWVLVWPVFWYYLLILLILPTHGALEPGELEVVKVAIILAVAFYSLMSASLVGLPAGLVEDMERGLVDKYASLGIPLLGELAGRSLAFAVLAFVGIGFSFIMAQPVAGFRYDTTLGLTLLALFAYGLITVFFMGMGLMFAALARRAIEVTVVGLALANFLPFAAGIFIPPDDLPPILQTFTRIFPPSILFNDAIVPALLQARSPALVPFASAATACLLLYVIGYGVYFWSRRQVYC